MFPTKTSNRSGYCLVGVCSIFSSSTTFSSAATSLFAYSSSSDESELSFSSSIGLLSTTFTAGTMNSYSELESESDESSLAFP